jgi:Zn-dependent protease
MAFNQNMALWQVLNFSSLVLILFICVLLHEMGHALMAKALDISASDIILSPIGGLARLESMEKYPRKEILIALAGPFVNFLVALVLFIYLYFIAYKSMDFNPYGALDHINTHALLYFIFFINLLLFLLNLVPAFPMDGGRVLRAVLSIRYGPLSATRIASVIGRIMAFIFVIVAVYTRYYALIAISIFVYFMALFEYRTLLMKQQYEEEKGIE